MAGSYANARTADWNGSTVKYNEANEIVIKTCLDCGYTKRHKYKVMECPSCGTIPMAFFYHSSHLIKYIDLYGLGSISIKDQDIVEDVLKAFG